MVHNPRDGKAPGVFFQLFFFPWFRAHQLVNKILRGDFNVGNLRLSSDKVPDEVYRRLIRLLVKKTAGEKPVLKAGKKKKAAQ